VYIGLYNVKKINNKKVTIFQHTHSTYNPQISYEMLGSKEFGRI
jgi:hypothetical protein